MQDDILQQKWCGSSSAELMIAIQSVPPVSTEYPEDSRYNTLLQISIGQVW